MLLAYLASAPTLVLVSLALLVLLLIASAAHSFASLVRLGIVLALVSFGITYGMTLYAHASEFHARAAARLTDIERSAR